MTAIYLFTRDLRLDDNLSLNRCLAENEIVYPMFLLNRAQIVDNPYYSSRAVLFMAEALVDLDRQLGGKLTVIVGDIDRLTSVRDELGAKIYIAHDYTSFAERRAKALDAVITRDELFAAAIKPYLVFAAYHRAAIETGMLRPTPLCDKLRAKIKKSPIHGLDPRTLTDIDAIPVAYRGTQPASHRGGTAAAQTHMVVRNYQDRDYAALGVTTLLSPYIKFGCISLRQAYYIPGRGESARSFRREIIYRQFFYQMYENYRARVELEFSDTTDYSTDSTSEVFINWCRGATGIPAVDAGMRELNNTGYMHNRFRMICASYLIHNLGVHWTLGERYFANQLRDYDPTINKMNWGWCAGLAIFNRRPNTVAFNPYLQAKKYDREGIYINFWLNFGRENT